MRYGVCMHGAECYARLGDGVLSAVTVTVTASASAHAVYSSNPSPPSFLTDVDQAHTRRKLRSAMMITAGFSALVETKVPRIDPCDSPLNRRFCLSNGIWAVSIWAEVLVGVCTM